MTWILITLAFIVGYLFAEFRAERRIEKQIEELPPPPPITERDLK